MITKTQKNVFQENKAPALNNSQYVRNHLANERTYLAWMRTAISLISIGVVIGRLRYIINPQLPASHKNLLLGVFFATAGMIVVFLANQQYFVTLKGINTETYTPNKRWILVFSFLVTFLGVGVFYVLSVIPIA